MVATDGHRLARVKLPALNADSEMEAIIAPKALNLLLRLTTTNGLHVLPGSQISFHADETSVYSRVIEGPYPPYEKVIPPGTRSSSCLTAATFSEH